MRKQRGFTLLELLIVVVILGVLALIAAPTMLNAADKAKDGAVKANVSAAASSVTSRFALNTNETATEVADGVVGVLNPENENPMDDANAAFATSGTAAGSVVLAADDAANTITINGYDKNGASVLQKVVAAPAND